MDIVKVVKKMNNCNLVNKTNYDISIEEINSISKKIIKDFKVKKKYTVVLVDSKEIFSLNAKYRGIKKTTDVLSFNILQENYLGDIIISPRDVKKNANKFNKEINDEMKLMIVHGLLHLLGYDHLYKKDAKIMQQLEKKYTT